MELDITVMLDENLMNYSASAAELGYFSSGECWKITWNNALNTDVTLVSTASEIQECKDYFKCFGAWDNEKIAAWSDNEVNALVIQLVSGDLREYLDAKEEGGESFQDYEERAGGRIYEGFNGKLYYYIGE